MTYGQLTPEVKGTFLYCPADGDQYSACPADYWNVPTNLVIRCPRGHFMVWVVERCQLVRV